MRATTLLLLLCSCVFGACSTLPNRDPLSIDVSAAMGTVPRYGEAVLEIPVTVSALSMARQVLGFVNAQDQREVAYKVRGKLEGGVFGARRFTDEGTFELPADRVPADRL